MINELRGIMELTEIIKKGVTRIQIRTFLKRKRKHSAFVALYIDKLYEYHSQQSAYDFIPLRNQLLKELLIYARKNCRYYKNILPGIDEIRSLSESEFKNIPFLTKDLIRNHSEDLKSKIIPEACLLHMKTSGSTGNPLAFWASGNTDPVHQKMIYNLYNYMPDDKILAMDGSLLTEDLTGNGIYWIIKNDGNMLPYGGMALSSLYLSEKTLPLYVEFLFSYKPEFIRGYPAFITEIAQYILKNKIQVNFQMKGIELTSELVDDCQVKSITKAFHCKVFGQYGHKEACVFGYTVDDSFAYYCSPFYGVTEVINENNQQVGIGEEGEIVVTGFSNFGMPFIRYRTCDRAIFGGEENGIVKLNKVLGRTADYIFNKSKEKILMTSLNFGLRCKALSRIAQWQIVQNSIGEVVINIQNLAGYSPKDEEEILQIFSQAGIRKCDFVYNKEFIKTEAGKVKFVIQNITAN